MSKKTIRKECKILIKLSKEKGMTFEELEKVLRNIYKEMKEQAKETRINRTKREKSFKEKADEFVEMNKMAGDSDKFFRKKTCKEKYTELLCTYYTYSQEITSEESLRKKVAERLEIQDNTMKYYVKKMQELLQDFFKNVPDVKKWQTIDLIKYTINYIETYF